MATTPSQKLPLHITLLADMGYRIKQARLRRSQSQRDLCTQVSVSRPTLAKIEAGDATVSVGLYGQVLEALGLAESLGMVACSDPVGRQLQDDALPKRAPAARRR